MFRSCPRSSILSNHGETDIQMSRSWVLVLWRDWCSVLRNRLPVAEIEKMKVKGTGAAKRLLLPK